MKITRTLAEEIVNAALTDRKNAVDNLNKEFKEFIASEIKKQIPEKIKEMLNDPVLKYYIRTSDSFKLVDESGKWIANQGYDVRILENIPAYNKTGHANDYYSNNFHFTDPEIIKKISSMDRRLNK